MRYGFTSVAACVALMGASACGLGYTVQRDMLKQIAIEYKLTLFDAENDVSIAMDERDKIQREIRLVYKDKHATQAQIEEAESDEERAAEKGDATAEAVAEYAAEVFEMRIDYLDMRIDFLRARKKGQDGIVAVALAKYELEKATLVKKNNVRGSEDIDLADFKEQVSDYVERAQDFQLDLDELAQEVEAEKQAWLVEREKLSKMSGGGIGSTWVEEGVLWGEE